jgi:hypothetical protein
MRMYLDDLNNPEELYKHISDVRNVQWFYDDGIPVDYETSALADKYTEYAMMCRVGDETPIPYNEWLLVQSSLSQIDTVKIDPESVAHLIEEEESIRRHNEYIKMCQSQDVDPLDYWDWLDFDKKYQEHVRTAGSPLSPATFQKFVDVRNRVQELTSEPEVVRLTKERDDLASRLDCLQSNIQKLKSEQAELCQQRHELILENEEMIDELESLKSAAGQRTTPANQPLYPHYFREVTNVTHVDVYWLLQAWDVSDPCVQHAVKKLIAAGRRGAKDKVKDLNEAKDSIVRALELGQTI